MVDGSAKKEIGGNKMVMIIKILLLTIVNCALCSYSAEKYVEMAKPHVENFVKLYSNQEFEKIYKMSAESSDKLYEMDSGVIEISFTREEQARNKEAAKIILTMIYDLLGRVKSGEISDYNYRLSDPPTMTILYSAKFEKAHGTIALVFWIVEEQVFFQEFELSSDLLDLDFRIKYKEELEKLNLKYPSRENIRSQFEEHYSKAIEYGSKSKFDSAKVELEETLTINSFFTKAGHDLKIVEDVFNKKIKHETGVHIFKGVYNLEKDNYDLAMTEINKAIEIDPRYAEAYLYRGIVYRYKSLYDLAIADINIAIDINPKYSVAYRNRGFVHHCKGFYDMAIADYAKAIEIDPNYADAYGSRGYTYFLKGLYDQAISDFKRTLKINPYDPYAYNYLVEAKQRLQEDQENK